MRRWLRPGRPIAADSQGTSPHALEPRAARRPAATGPACWPGCAGRDRLPEASWLASIQVLNALAQPRSDAMPGHVNRGDRKAQLLGDGLRLAAVNGRGPKRAPRTVLELVAYFIGRPLEKLPLILL